MAYDTVRPSRASRSPRARHAPGGLATTAEQSPPRARAACACGGSPPLTSQHSGSRASLGLHAASHPSPSPLRTPAHPRPPSNQPQRAPTSSTRGEGPDPSASRPHHEASRRRWALARCGSRRFRFHAAIPFLKHEGQHHGKELWVREAIGPRASPRHSSVSWYVPSLRAHLGGDHGVNQSEVSGRRRSVGPPAAVAWCARDVLQAGHGAERLMRSGVARRAPTRVRAPLPPPLPRFAAVWFRAWGPRARPVSCRARTPETPGGYRISGRAPTTIRLSTILVTNAGRFRRAAFFRRNRGLMATYDQSGKSAIIATVPTPPAHSVPDEWSRPATEAPGDGGMRIDARASVDLAWAQPKRDRDHHRGSVVLLESFAAVCG
eukprot:gene231-biopygen11152